MKNNIRIFIACHKPTWVPKNYLFTPVQVGAALTEERYEGMLPDNTGDNISDKNKTYCELTAQYWAWKNQSCSYYGFFHYRRYLSFEKIYPVEASGKIQGVRYICPYVEIDDIRDDLGKYRLEERWMEQQIVKFELLTVLHERINTTVYRQFCQYHPQEDLELLLKILKKRNPEYGEAAGSYMSSKDIYYMNMYIMKQELFEEYMEWLFGILDEFTIQYKRKNKGEIQPRLLGYLGERLFGIFYTYQRLRGVKCAELQYLKFYNTDLDVGKGVQTNIRSFRLKPTKYEIKIDMRKLNRWFPAGSRRRIIVRNLFLR